MRRDTAQQRKGSTQEGEESGSFYSEHECFPDWAYGHTSYTLSSDTLPGLTKLPCPTVGHQGYGKKGHYTQQWAISGVFSLRLKSSQGIECPKIHPQR